MYELLIKPEIDRIFRKLAKKNKKQLLQISKKIEEIRTNPNHEYKHLHSPLQNFCRVHIDKHYVLIFRIIHDEKAIEIYYYDHHDNVYHWKP
ncbi:type II toxin-antitoxin system RelE/ParE family toxin [Candidatus Woesearchaeota archaeon]|nr:type II toxin-antitoxin system RelE/ParE family toxin [Candidatus Woesearchaeota archaeon]